MIIGKVIKNIWATQKIENLDGYRFVLVSPINQQGEDVNKLIVAVDQLGVGNGDFVFIVEGAAAFKFLKEKIPIDAMVIGLADEKDEEFFR